jgi:hypothetical protein
MEWIRDWFQYFKKIILRRFGNEVKISPTYSARGRAIKAIRAIGFNRPMDLSSTNADKSNRSRMSLSTPLLSATLDNPAILVGLAISTS